MTRCAWPDSRWPAPRLKCPMLIWASMGKPRANFESAYDERERYARL